jgi:tRNA/rRNA methyltransferase
MGEMAGGLLERVSVVLVRARNPNNIGAVARAMQDFGCREMRVVNDFPVPFETARSAVDAGEVLAAAAACGSVAEAVADCTLVVGTTAVGERDLEHELLPLAEAAKKIRAEVEVGGKIALLFGSEKTGLSNEEMSHCQWLLTIPMQEKVTGRHLSMNLGQAVAVCLYELVRNGEFTGNASAEVTTGAATAAELENLTTLLNEVLEKTEYKRRHPANSDVAMLRRLVLRMGVGAGDAPIWMGILRQVLWKIGLRK